MKLLNKKYLYFVLVFLGVLIVDYIFVIGLFTQVFSEPPENIILAYTIMIGLFVVIPATVSYHLIFKRQKDISQTSENTKDFQVNNKMVIAIVVFLVAALGFAFKSLTTVRWEPYGYTEVKDEVFTKPSNLTFVKTIGQETYYLKDNEQWGTSLYQTEDENSQEERYIFDIPLNIKSIVDYWYDSKTTSIYVVRLSDENIKTGFGQLMKFSFNKDYQYVEKVETLHTRLITKLYIDKILDFYPETETLLIESMMGDGCGGGGNIWTLTGKISRTIQEYSFGCSDKSKPRFIGYNSPLLYFATYDPDRTLEYGGDLGLKEIYSLNPRTGEKKTVMNSGFPENVIRTLLSEDKKVFILTTDKNQIYTLDISKDSKAKEASPSAQ